MRITRILLSLLILSLAAAAPALAQDDSGQKKRHPSYNLMGRDQPPPDSPLNPNFVVAEEARLSESGFWRSGYINESLAGLVVADIDRDGQNEMVFASSNKIHVTRVPRGGEKMGFLATYSVPSLLTVVSVDVLDLNGDGRMEIIASAINEQKTASSMILSFTGSELKLLADKISWYMRVVGPPEGRYLVGQKPGTNLNSPYTGNVMHLSFDGSRVKSGGLVGLPPAINVFNFNYGRLGSSGQQMTVAIKYPSEHIFLFEGLNQAWESNEEYGGTMNYTEPPGSADGTRRREYLPSRLILADIDGDGRNELIVAKNDRGGVSFMSSQRSFSSGSIRAFRYANMSLTPFFRTRTLPGPGVDYALADFNNNGTLDLVVAVVTEQKSGMMKEGRSVIVAYEIGPASSPAEE